MFLILGTRLRLSYFAALGLCRELLKLSSLLPGKWSFPSIAQMEPLPRADFRALKSKGVMWIWWSFYWLQSFSLTDSFNIENILYSCFLYKNILYLKMKCPYFFTLLSYSLRILSGQNAWRNDDPGEGLTPCLLCLFPILPSRYIPHYCSALDGRSPKTTFKS